MRRINKMVIVGAVNVVLVVSGCAGTEKAPLSSPTSLATPPAASSVPEPPTADEIAALFTLWNAALATGDAGKVADRYAPDAVLLPTQSNRVRRTREQIVDYFRHFLGFEPSGTIKESTITVLGPTAAIDTGVYVFRLTGEGRRQQVEARYTFVHELRDGKWLIVNHHSSAMPEPSK